MGGSDTDHAAGRRSWWLPAGTFLAGCVLGGVVMGFGGVGDDSTSNGSAAVGADAGGRSERGGAGDGPPDAADSGLYVRVPESCVQTAEDATSLVEHVDRVVAAVADLEPERLRQTVDDVQQIRDEIQDVADQCRAVAAQRLQDAAGEDAAPATPAS